MPIKKCLQCTYMLLRSNCITLVYRILRMWDFGFSSFNCANRSLKYPNCYSQSLRLRRPIFKASSLYGIRVTNFILDQTILALITWQRHSHVRKYKEYALHHMRYQIVLRNFLATYTVPIMCPDWVPNWSHMFHVGYLC